MKNPKTIYLNNNRLIKYKLFKTKIYKNNFKILIKIKKIINIIYKYNFFNKKILLINHNPLFIKKLLELTSDNKYLFLTKLFLKNKIICYNYLNKKKLNKQKFFNNKVHIIIILNSLKDQSNFNMTSFTKTPVFFFNVKSSNKISLTFENNFKLLNQTMQNSFIYSLLSITFKKSKKN